MTDRHPDGASAATTPGRLSESGRVEAFSDGVLAIALTLLALDLRVPSGRPGSFGHELLEQWPSYVAYLASFVYIGVIWANHHALFTRINRVDRGLLARNLALLLPASVLPFPTAALATAFRVGTPGDQRAALVLYGLIAFAMAATWLIVFTYLDRRRDLLSPDVPDGYFRRERRRAAPGMILPCAAVAIGFVSPLASLVIFLSLSLFYAVTSEGSPERGHAPEASVHAGSCASLLARRPADAPSAWSCISPRDAPAPGHGPRVAV
jgi:uncharacterized membrane protein